MELSGGQLILTITCIYVTIIGSLCTLILMVLIVDQNIWNDFTKLVFLMTVTQFVYDIFITSFTFDEGIWISIICLIGGVSSFLISTLISYSVFFVLYTAKILKIKKWRSILALFVIIPNVAIAAVILQAFYTSNVKLLLVGKIMCTWVRLICIVLNFMFFLGCKYLVGNMTKFKRDRGMKLSDTDIAMIVLVDRLKYYPLVQAVSRIPACFYEFIYGYEFGYYQMHTTRFNLAVGCYNAALIAPVGYIIIFLTMQPKSYKHLKQRITYLLCGCNNATISSSSDSSRSDSNTEDGSLRSNPIHLSQVGQPRSADMETRVSESRYISEPNLVAKEESQFNNSVHSQLSQYSDNGETDDAYTMTLADIRYDDILANERKSSNLTYSSSNYKINDSNLTSDSYNNTNATTNRPKSFQALSTSKLVVISREDEIASLNDEELLNLLDGNQDSK